MRFQTWSRLLLTCTLAQALISFGGAAEAQEYEFEAPSFQAGPQWGGFYVGAQLGGAWNDTDWRYANRNWFNTAGPKVVIDRFQTDASGVTGGGQLGYNFQAGPWVLGVEGSLAALDLESSSSNPVFNDRYTASYSSLATVTGRLGYSVGSWLAYAKGGWAGADVELTIFDRGTPARASDSAWANGWTAGAGLEYALSGGLSLGVDYGYTELDVPQWKLACRNCPTGFTGGGVPAVDGDVAIQAVTARLNYRFGG